MSAGGATGPEPAAAPPPAAAAEAKRALCASSAAARLRAGRGGGRAGAGQCLGRPRGPPGVRPAPNVPHAVGRGRTLTERNREIVPTAVGTILHTRVRERVYERNRE